MRLLLIYHQSTGFIPHLVRCSPPCGYRTPAYSLVFLPYLLWLHSVNFTTQYRSRVCGCHANCPSRPVFLMKRAAFCAYFASASILLTFTDPAGSLLSTSLHISILNLWCNLHSCNTFQTVCRSLLHSHLPLSNPGTFLPCKKCFWPILPVRICTISALKPFRIPPWIRRTDFDGTGIRRRRSFPFSPSIHLASHSFCAVCFITWLLAERSGGVEAGGAVDMVSTSIVLPFLFFFFLQPVAILAATSAFSFPSISLWAGTQCFCTAFACNFKSSSAETMLVNID